MLYLPVLEDAHEHSNSLRLLHGLSSSEKYPTLFSGCDVYVYLMRRLFLRKRWILHTYSLQNDKNSHLSSCYVSNTISEFDRRDKRASPSEFCQRDAEIWSHSLSLTPTLRAQQFNYVLPMHHFAVAIATKGLLLDLDWGVCPWHILNLKHRILQIRLVGRSCSLSIRSVTLMLSWNL